MNMYRQKASALLEALPYIKNFYQKIVVVKIGGSSLSWDQGTENILQNIVFMKFVGMRPLVIHGGGAAINDALKEHNIVPHFVNGLRVTEGRTMAVVLNVLLNQINKNLVHMIEKWGAKAVGMLELGENLISVSKFKMSKMDCHQKKFSETDPVDLGFVGQIQKINAKQLKQELNDGKIPVIAPIGWDQKGQAYNINADIVAGEFASLLEAEKLVYLTDVEGIFRNIHDRKTLISTIHAEEIETLIHQGIIAKGMLPKVRSCLSALQNGAKKGHIISGGLLNALLLEIFTDQGIGTEIIS